MMAGWHPAYLSMIAAGLMVVLGVVVLARNPGRGLNRAFFAFAAVNASMIVFSSLNDLMVGTEEALRAIRSYWYFAPWFPVILLILALHIPTRVELAFRWRIAIYAALLLPAALFTVAFAFDHSLFITLTSINNVQYYTWTPLAVALVGIHGIAVGAGLLILAGRFRRCPHELQRRQLAWAQVAYLVGFVPQYAITLVHVSIVVPASFASTGFAIATIAVNGAAVLSLRPWDRSLITEDTRQVVLAAYIGSTAFGLTFALLQSPLAIYVFSALSSVAMSFSLTYAILKYDIFNLDLRLRQLAPYGALGLMLVSAFALYVALTVSLAPTIEAFRLFLVAGVLTAASALPLHKASTRISTHFGWFRVNNAGAIAERRLEIYRAAVENAVTDGEDPDTSDALKHLRSRLELSTRDHRFMVQVVRDTAGTPALAPSGPLREGDLVMRKYRVERFLGAGSFGRAVLAEHVNMNRKVVIKEPHESYRSRAALSQLSKEARLVARVQHPNIVALYDFEELHDTGYLVFEYVSGGSLEDRLKNGPLPREDAYAVFADVLRGLDAVHRTRIAHLDLKPANILLSEGGRAKITDFGIASEVHMSATLGRSVGSVAHPGTLLYMAPEQVRGRRDPGPMADLYAAGAVFHEMLTGKRYLDFPENPLLVQEAILYEAPRLDDPRLTPSEQDLLASLLAKAPADRHGGAADVLAALCRMDGTMFKGRHQNLMDTTFREA